MENRTLFMIYKTPPFEFDIGYSVKEKPLPLERQKSKVRPAKAKTQKKISEMKNDVKKLPFEVMETPQIIEAMQDLGHDNFVDPTFPPVDSSIYDSTNIEGFPLGEVPVWKRPCEFMEGKPRLFEENIDPNDIRQGALGNCWFLASISSLAENPAMIKRLFITEEYNEFGIYQLRVCKNGEWVVVTIDDYIPCYLNGGPMFSSANGNELWVIFLEKAYAKLHGNYWQLRAGFVHHGMMDLSGCPTWSFDFPEGREDYSKIADFGEKFWKTLKSADDYGHSICSGTPGVDVYTEGGGPKEESGIVPGHAYSIIQAKEYKNIRLLNIRNPWGQFEWGGDWWDNHHLWTDEMIKAFNPKFDLEDGSFWMDYEEFFKYFCNISICKTQKWQELRLKGKFIKVEDETTGSDWVISQFYYTFKLDKAAHIEIGIHQEDERILGADRRPTLDASYIILKRENNGELTYVDSAELSSERDVEGSFSLEAGNYAVMPYTTGAYLRKSGQGFEPVQMKVDQEGKSVWNQMLYMTLGDIFRKADLQFDGILSARELNIIGNITGDQFMTNLNTSGFSMPGFENISHTAEGVTQLGFIQMVTAFGEEKLMKFLKKLGYDKTLQSLKSRVFVMTFHSTEKITTKVGNTIETDLAEKAMNLLLENDLSKTGAQNAKSDDNVVVFRKYHEKAYANSYGVVNKIGKDVEVTLDMTSSTESVYTPKSGKSTLIVPAGSVQFIGSSIVQHNANSFGTWYSFSSRIID